MKDQVGIDLSDLTEAQRKMCVRLLAMNNVQFEQNQQNYIATLTVPSNDVNNYLNSHKPKISTNKKKQNKQTTKNNKQNQLKHKEKLANKNLSTNKEQVKIKKQSSMAKNSKKSLFKTIKLGVIKKLQLLHPQVELYIFPKRLPLPTLQQQLQLVYQSYWQGSKLDNQLNFLNCFYQIICAQKGSSNKSKNDQNLVNVLQTMNHFQHKELGIRIFLMFLSQACTKQQLTYFLVLRALLQQLSGEKIIQLKTKPKMLGDNLLNNIQIDSKSYTSSSNFSTKSRLKWHPIQKQISQNICYNFLKVVVPNNQNVQQIFQKLTQWMYYCESKKSNFIMYYDLMDFMIKIFNKQCQQTSVSNLQLSYSNNDSTLNDIMVESTKKSFQRPIQTKYQIQFTPECEKQQQNQQSQNFDNNQILMETALERAQEMCIKIGVPAKLHKQIIERVRLCIQSILTMDKMKWVESMQIQGNQPQLYFIQQIQMEYRNINEQGLKLSMANCFVKRIFSGPGFIKLFSSHINF